MSTKRKITISFIIFIIGIIIFASEYFNSKRIEVYDYMNELYYTEEISDIRVDEVNDNEITVLDESTSQQELSNNENNEESSTDTSYNFTFDSRSIYIGYLIIPDINLKKGFTEIDSPYNNVNKNIEILSPSDYPDKVNGNVIFAAHSGNSSVSYFNKLYLLNVGSSVLIEYNNNTYNYKITNIYKVEKTGKVEVTRNKNKSTVTLITCTKNDSKTQTIYIGELISVE